MRHWTLPWRRRALSGGSSTVLTIVAARGRRWVCRILCRQATAPCQEASVNEHLRGESKRAAIELYSRDMYAIEEASVHCTV